MLNMNMVDAGALMIMFLLLIAIYYGFLSISIDVFTYKHPKKVYMAIFSIFTVFISLRVSYLLGFIMLLSFLFLQKLSLKETLIVAFSTQFGFMMGMAVIMIFLTSLGFVFNIPSLQMNMTFEDMMKLLMKGSK